MDELPKAIEVGGCTKLHSLLIAVDQLPGQRAKEIGHLLV